MKYKCVNIENCTCIAIICVLALIKGVSLCFSRAASLNPGF